jgi:hypothetical protein
VIVHVQTAAGAFALDAEHDELEPLDDSVAPREPVPTTLPRVLDADAAGSTIVAAVDTKPPLVVSHDAGTTWRESGRGLPPIRSVAIDADDPDRMAAAARNRVYVSTDGGRFWRALTSELPEIERVEIAVG